MMVQTDLDKLLKSFEEQNSSMDFYILLSSEGIPFKSSIQESSKVLKTAGLLYDLILFSKRTLDELKRANYQGQGNQNMTLRMRLKNGEEIIIVQEQDLYLITKQVCKATEVPVEPEKK